MGKSINDGTRFGSKTDILPPLISYHQSSRKRVQQLKKTLKITKVVVVLLSCCFFYLLAYLLTANKDGLID